MSYSTTDVLRSLETVAIFLVIDQWISPINSHRNNYCLLDDNGGFSLVHLDFSCCQCVCGWMELYHEVLRVACGCCCYYFIRLCNVIATGIYVTGWYCVWCLPVRVRFLVSLLVCSLSCHSTHVVSCHCRVRMTGVCQYM